MRTVRLRLITAAMCFAVGCSSPPSGSSDAGHDGGVTEDAGAHDAGVVDSGVPDSGNPDSGIQDSGTPDASVTVFDNLSEFGLFTSGPDDAGHLTTAPGNVEYQLTTALFSDYALKQRTLRIPPGSTALYNTDDVLDLPVGTIISKTFSFPADQRAPGENVNVVETRLLIHQPTGWEAYPFVWNAGHTDAVKRVGGQVVPVTFIQEDGGSRSFSYLVPSRNQCLQCHHTLDDAGTQVMRPIGVKVRYLNRTHDYGGGDENQLEYFADEGLLDGLPSDGGWPRLPNAFDVSDGSLDERARTYLEINCGHCHRPNSTAGKTSQLFLNFANTDPYHLGVCKRPGSAGSGAGGTYDIQPGHHDESILWFRMQTEESGKMMPQIGRTLRHDEGAELLQQWIDAMPDAGCD